MKKGLYLLFGLMVIASMLFVSCAPQATEAPAVEEATAVVEEPTDEPVVEEATEVPATEAPAPTEAPVVEEPAGPKVIYFNETGGYTSIDPFTNAWHSTPSYAVFVVLWEMSPDLKEYTGIIAESWEFAEDNMSMTVTLKDGLTFTDGSPINAEALKWNLDKYLDPELASPGGGTLRQSVASVDVVDDLTFTINLIAPFAYLMDELAGKEIASPTAYEELGPEEYAQQLISAGPFIVTEQIPDVSISYVKNENYTYGNSFCQNPGVMPFDELVIKYISDEGVAYAALETGELDVAGIPPQYLEQARANPNIEVVESVTTSTRYFGMNNEFYPFTELGVRQAIAYAINREEINLIAMEGQGVELYQPLAPGNLGFNPAMEEYGMATSNDVEKANAMLEALGFVDSDGDGIREEPNGKKMQYELMFPQDPTVQRIAETLQSQLSAIGIGTFLVVVDDTLMRQRTAEGSHQMFTWLYGLLTPNITTYIFHSSRIGASNRPHVVDPVLDGLLEAQDQQLDPVLRQEAVDAVATYIIDNRFIVPLLSPMSFGGYRSDKLEPGTIDILGGIWFCDLQIK
jgi:peptide/nickel transport system substrate-binding protein